MPDNVSFRLLKNHQEVSKWYPFWIGTMVGFVFVFFAFLVAVSDITRANRLNTSFLDFSNSMMYGRVERSKNMMQEGSARVTIVSPAVGSQVSGKTAVVATVFMGGRIVSAVKLLVDGVETAAFSAEPYVYTWDTAGVRNGEHVIAVLAIGADGYTTLAQQKVMVAN